MASPANQGFNANAAFVVTKEGVLVFDALGTPALGAALKHAIARVTQQPIKRVIISHFHADHFYGLQSLVGPGVEVWAHQNGKASLAHPDTQARLEQRRQDLAPFVNKDTRLIGADRYIDFDRSGVYEFSMGGVRFQLIDMSGAHSGDDVMLFIDTDKVLLAGDLYFSGRIPFVGQADTLRWMEAMQSIALLFPEVAIPGHGPASHDPKPDIELTREYLLFLRESMGQAVRELKPFDEAYAHVDWSRFEPVPAFESANRINAYGVYLNMEQEYLRESFGEQRAP